MNPEDTAFVTYRRRKGRYIKDPELEEIKLEDTVDVFVTLECIHLYISYCISLYPDGDVCSFDRESQ